LAQAPAADLPGDGLGEAAGEVKTLATDVPAVMLDYPSEIILSTMEPPEKL